MNAKSELVRLLEERARDELGEQVDRLLEEATSEALAEAKDLIRGVLLRVMIEQAADQLKADRIRQEPATPKEGKGVDSSEEERADRESLLAEMQAIQEQIAENEERLAQTGPPASQGRADTSSSQDSASSNGQVNLRDAQTAGEGVYLYGVIAGSNGNPPLTELPSQGIDPKHPVRALACGPIQAIVSQVALEQFGQEALEANWEDLEWVASKARRHEGVQRSINSEQPLVPMPFCTIFRDEDSLRKVLAQHSSAFLETLASLEGKREWGLKMYCQRDILAQEARKSFQESNKGQDIDDTSAGLAYFATKRIEKTVNEEVERLINEGTQSSHDRLADLSEEAVINSLQSKELSDREEELLLNAAYLVADARLDNFRGELQQLIDTYGERGFIYELTGPWPAYNFVDLSLEGEGENV